VKRTVLIVLMVVLAIALPVLASVAFDASTGTGFVGKGDVQLAFGWNNAQLQRYASGVTFGFDSSDVYEGVCVWTTGEGTRGEKTHSITRKKHVDVYGSVAYDARMRNQITGFILKGYAGDPVVSGNVPTVGGVCPGNGTDGAWESVTLVSSSGGLITSYGGVTIPLPNTPPAIVVVP
jgi:hypothetical protein